MDLIGPFNVIMKGNEYILTVIYMLTYYIICIPLMNKSTDTVVSPCFREVYCWPGGSRKILLNNENELKNSLFFELATHSFSSPHRPQVNGWIEASHKSIKNCVRKLTMKGQVKWDGVLNTSCAAHNFFPNGQSQESPFFFMFGRDVYIHTLANLLQPKWRFLGQNSSLLSIEMLREVYMLAAINSKGIREKHPSMNIPPKN